MLFVSVVAFALLGQQTASDANVAKPADFRLAIDRLRITEGEFAGGYRLQRDDGRINWYFANLGLVPLCGTRPKEVRQYLDLYLVSVSPGSCTIQDVRKIGKGIRQAPDSDDSYASTFLSLACAYQRANPTDGWWKTNLPKLKRIARKVLLDSQKESGLVTVFAGDKARTLSYLMDNCEVYRGLADFATLLANKHDPDAKEFADAAARVAEGVAGLFDEKVGAFRVADADAAKTFYPLRAAQVFPEVFGVPLGNKTLTRQRYDSAWRFMNATGDRWERGQVADGSLGEYPWMLLGYAAAKRGEFDLARTQLNAFEDELKSAKTRPAYTAIQELGWAIRIQELLGEK
jgi:hypothetical protein